MIYLVPEDAAGHGLGHVQRLTTVARRLPEPSVLVSQASRKSLAERLDRVGVTTIPALPSDAEGAMLFDRRHIRLSDLADVPAGVTVCAIDAAGPAGDWVDVAVDALPGRRSGSPGNETGTLLPRSVTVRTAAVPERPERILVSFGGEDPAHLTELVIDRLIRWDLLLPEQLSVVRGPLFERSIRLPQDAERGTSARLIDSPAELGELLHDYDLVLTSYGITAFEALAAGCRVAIVNPSRYHDRLTRRAGLRRVGGPSFARIRGTVLSRRRLSEELRGSPTRRSENLAPAQAPRELAEVITPYLTADGLGCPLCGRRWNPAIERMPQRSFFRCQDCGIVYLSAFGKNPIVYDESYFFEEYRAQYGRSYLEDFDHIAAMGSRRLTGISRELRTTGSGRLLDLGCAYGPFLRAAVDAGYEAYGIDVSESAVRFVRTELGIPAAVGRIGELSPQELFGVDRFDVITMWYVIEHLEHLGSVLEWVAERLKPGGVFALATPNYDGVSRRRDRRSFLARSPRDHRSIWSPRTCTRTLSRFGMDVRRIRITGHHPERFALGASLPAARPLLAYWSRLAGRGDTFEAYAVRRGSTQA